MSRRRKLSTKDRIWIADYRASKRADLRAAIAALTPEQIDAILMDVHGGAAAGKTFGEIAAKHNVKVSVLCKVCIKYSDTIRHTVPHLSIAEATAWRATRRDIRKAASASRFKLPAPTPEGSPS
jgi:hypothetical protein